MADPTKNPLHRSLAWQRLAMLAEDAWASSLWPVIVLAIAATLLWSGLLDALPRGAPLAVLALLAVAFLWSLRGLLGLRTPADQVVLRKLERANGIEHRAASSITDQVVKESGDDELWQEHLRRKLAAVQNVRITPPTSRWRLVDPRAVLLPALLSAFTAFVLGNGELTAGLRNAATLTAPIVPKPISFDAWLKPPAYTGKAPILLTSPAMVEKLRGNPEITVPENAVLNLRLQGASKPNLEILSPGSPTQDVKLADTKIETQDGVFTATARLDRPATLRLMDGDTQLAQWPVSTLVDQPPQIEIVGEPISDDMGHLKVKWHASDDYGVKSVTADIALADDQQSGKGFEGNGVFLYDPPQLKIAMGKPGAKDDTETTQADLAPHPWAGLFAELTLTAKDGAGHSTSTPPKRIKLPERDFIMPLARALVEQRKTFILSPDAAPDASTMISSMMLYPFSLQGRSGLVLNINAMNSRLSHASSPDDVVAVAKDIWPLITAIEDGTLSDTKAELKNLADQLRQALREGASKEKIAELMRRMREAMNKLAQEMSKEAQKRMAEGAQPQDGQSISPQDLQDMLDQIGKLGEKGDKDGAEQLLSQLDQMLQNLQPGAGASAQGGAPGKGGMDGLQGLMGQQRKLMDKTQRLGKGNKDPGQGSPGDGQGGNGKSGQGDNGKGDSGDSLAEQQNRLKQQLDKLGKGLGSEEGGEKLGEAGRAMGEAEKALREGNRDEALRQQRQALQALRDGLGKMAQKMGKGKGGTNRAEGNGDNDPLGRPRATLDPSAEPDRNIVPSELARRKAQEILEELRGRANSEGLDDGTRAYIDRLLKDLN